MKVLVSPVSTHEARAGTESGADIVDVKNSPGGSLAELLPWVNRTVSTVLEDLLFPMRATRRATVDPLLAGCFVECCREHASAAESSM